jgi:hypothetical protein
MIKPAASFVIILFFFFVLSGSLYADTKSTGTKVNIRVPLKLQIFEDEKPTKNFIVGTLLITDLSGKLEIFWDAVFVHPLHSQKIVLLKPEHYYSRQDIFENIIINKDNFSFIMSMRPLFNRIKISGYKNENNTFHFLKCAGIFKGNHPGDKPIKVEWRQVKKVIMPYREVY